MVGQVGEGEGGGIGDLVVGQERVGGQEEEGDGGGIGDLVAGQEDERIQRDLVVGQEGQGGTVGVQATWWLDKRDRGAQ